MNGTSSSAPHVPETIKKSLTPRNPQSGWCWPKFFPESGVPAEFRLRPPRAPAQSLFGRVVWRQRLRRFASRCTANHSGGGRFFLQASKPLRPFCYIAMLSHSATWLSAAGAPNPNRLRMLRVRSHTCLARCVQPDIGGIPFGQVP